MDEQMRWLTVQGACERAQCGKRVIYAAVRKGRLAASKLNDRGDLRFAPAWIDSWIEGAKVRAGRVV